MLSKLCSSGSDWGQPLHLRSSFAIEDNLGCSYVITLGNFVRGGMWIDRDGQIDEDSQDEYCEWFGNMQQVVPSCFLYVICFLLYSRYGGLAARMRDCLSIVRNVSFQGRTWVWFLFIRNVESRQIRVVWQTSLLTGTRRTVFDIFWSIQVFLLSWTLSMTFLVCW